MDSQEYKKLKSAKVVFTILKFVGLAVLVGGGLKLSWHSFTYLVIFFNYLQGSGSANVVNAAAMEYFANLFKSMGIILVGLAALITFSILAGKKDKKMEDIKRAEEIKEAVDAAVKGE